MISCLNKKTASGFTCTGSNESDSWKKLHDVPNHMNCSHCAEHAKYGINGFHDNYNAGLGKGVHDKKNYKWFVDEVNTVYSFWKSQGEPVIKQ